jgi:DNA-binding protein HU-beta
MAKSLSKAQITATIAEKNGLTKKQASQVLECIAELACKHARNSFLLPGLGKLTLVTRPARQMVMQFGPRKGEVVEVPAKKVLKFRVAKAAREAILGAK